jgi:hypothetical protein
VNPRRPASLPVPGPGRPHHGSYSAPGPQASLLDVLALLLVVAIAFGLWTLIEAVV